MDPSFSLFTIFRELWSAGQNDWGNLHTLVTHFPFALLFLVPFFILGGLFYPKLQAVHFRTALALMTVGVIFIFLSTSSGELAAEKLSPSPAFTKTLELHLDLAEQSRLIFGILTVIFAIYVFNLQLAEKKLRPTNHRFMLFSFMIIYGYSLIVLGNTAHQGGKMVHEHGIKSGLYLHTSK